MVLVHCAYINILIQWRSQDPLNTLPALLSSNDPAARDIISLISECGSAKEVVMAVQEAVERVEHALENNDEEESEAQGKESLNKHIPPSPLDQLIILIDIYAASELSFQFS